MEKGTPVGRPTLALAALVAVVVAGVTFVISDAPEPPRAPVSPPTTSAPEQPESPLTLGVWGSDAEVAAHRRVVERYNTMSDSRDAELRRWPDAASMLADIDAGSAAPEVFLLPRSELASTVDRRRNQPLLDLVAARVDSLGDDYSRTALNAFTANEALQCMPYGSSPMVIYYNRDLIDFQRLAERDLPVPRDEDGAWTLEAFRAAARTATRPQLGTRGFSIEPTLEGLMPFVLSGGGQVFDNPESPTSLALGEEDSVEAVIETLEVLRDSPLTLTDNQLKRRTPAEWFADGRLGMFAGYRDLVPEFRRAEGLRFDVLPMPRLGSSATNGDLTGLCLADSSAAEAERAADFLVHLISSDSVAEVARTGHLAPSHLQVAFSDAFLQPARQPKQSSQFTLYQRDIALRPLTDAWPTLEEIAADGLQTLINAPVLDRDQIERVLQGIDEASRPVLDPDYEPPEPPDSSESSESSESSDSSESSESSEAPSATSSESESASGS